MKFIIETPNEKTMKEIIRLGKDTKNNLKIIMAPLLDGVDKKGFNAKSAKYSINLHDNKHMHVVVKLIK